MFVLADQCKIPTSFLQHCLDAHRSAKVVAGVALVHALGGTDWLIYDDRPNVRQLLDVDVADCQWLVVL